MSVSITSDAGPAPNLNVLMELLGTSESVAARIEQFKKAKADADEALARLKVGKDVVAAWEQVNDKQAQLDTNIARAKAAADEAIKVAAQAHADAKEILDGANARAASLLADVQGREERHKAAVALATEELNSQRSALAAQRADLAAQQDKLSAAQAVADKAHKDAEAAAAKAKAAEAEFKRKAAALAETLGKL